MAEEKTMTETCQERMLTSPKHLQRCGRPARAVVLFAFGAQRRVCGIHARMHERTSADVLWD